MESVGSARPRGHTREPHLSAPPVSAFALARPAPGSVLLGIDPGTAVLGYGAVVMAASRPRLVAAGAVRVPRKLGPAAGLAYLRAELDALLARIAPAVVVVEQAFAARNVRSALRIGEARGVVLASAAASGAEVVQYPPATVKKALVGSGGADKTQVARMVAAGLGLAEPPTPLDATDALALALTHVYKRSIGPRTIRK